MLVEEAWRYSLTEFDRQVFQSLVPKDHLLVRGLEAVEWNQFEEVLAGYYSPDRGQPAIKPLVMLKLEYLRYQYNLSDRQVMDRANTDVSFRYFLQVGVRFRLPDPSLLSRFRGRLGQEGFHRVFQELVGMARDAGLIKDRLRLKDASHVVANIAVPTTLGLLAQIRDRLLSAAAPFDPEAAEGYRINIELVRERTRELEKAEQLEARVTHLQEILNWTQEIPTPDNAEDNQAWKRLVSLKELTSKILYDQANPSAGRRTLSVVDPEARRGKHGGWYDGYVLDIMMDADSELITELNVLEAGGDEAKDAVQLVRREETIHGNDIQALSIDGVGFNGEVLRELEDPNGLAIETFVPPKKDPESELFQASDFEMHEDQSHVTCPAGQTSQYRQQDDRKHRWIFSFTRKQCAGCLMVQQCLGNPVERASGKRASGRVVRKNYYEKEYERVRQRAGTEEFAQVRKQHPAIERKINDVMRHHRGRRARYWGKAKVMCQECMTCLTVNIKRIVALLGAKRIAYA